MTDFDDVTELAGSICHQLAAHGERAGLDLAELAGSLALAAALFLRGNMDTADALAAWGDLNAFVVEFLQQTGDEHHGRHN